MQRHTHTSLDVVGDVVGCCWWLLLDAAGRCECCGVEMLADVARFAVSCRLLLDSAGRWMLLNTVGCCRML